MNEQQVENKLQEQGANAPRLNPEHINNTIILDEYHVFPGTTVTVCLLHLKNGAKVTGTNYGGVSPENFNPEMGMKLSYEAARQQVWPLEGYLLKQKLFEETI